MYHFVIRKIDTETRPGAKAVTVAFVDATMPLGNGGEITVRNINVRRNLSDGRLFINLPQTTGKADENGNVQYYNTVTLSRIAYHELQAAVIQEVAAQVGEVTEPADTVANGTDGVPF